MNWTESFTKQIAILNIVDAISTILGVGFGFFAEMNPLVLWLFSFGVTGFVIFLLVKLVFSVLWWYIDDRAISTNSFIFVWVIWFVYVVLTVWHIGLWISLLV